MRYPELLQRAESLRNPSRRLACVDSAIHTAHPLPCFGEPGRKVISSLLDSKGSVNKVSCLPSDLHPWWWLVHILTYFKDRENTGLKSYRISEGLSSGGFLAENGPTVKLIEQRQF